MKRFIAQERGGGEEEQAEGQGRPDPVVGGSKSCFLALRFHIWPLPLSPAVRAALGLAGVSLPGPRLAPGGCRTDDVRQEREGPSLAPASSFSGASELLLRLVKEARLSSAGQREIFQERHSKVLFPAP